MFEVRVICDPADTDRVIHALAAAFETGPARQYLTRDGERIRLYVTAEHRPEPNTWPAPEKAYVLAPNIISEIGWTADRARMHLDGRTVDREYWLRKAALLDRMALDDETARIHTDALAVAMNAALRLLEIDGEHSEGITDPRGYVRQEYARWSNNQ
ncbi:hypothetical protein ABZ478_01445 [Streptomyces sp. NPDC005706]|uniref:hypothetical protein n=1 Tax=Streptomyces sp. NPDC005706 TaxID=3157169 RepID=UPI003406BF5E